MVRTFVSIALGTLFVTGCFFPSFDDMQGGTHEKGDAPATELNATEVGAPQTGTPDGSATAADAATSIAADATVIITLDASGDVTTKSPGAGRIACGTEQCPVAPNSHCCADYVNPQFYCASPSHTIGWCTGGGGRAVFCDEKADCPGSQLCCEKGDVTSCSATCDGGKVLP